MKEEKNETPKNNKNNLNNYIDFTNYKTKAKIFPSLVESLDLEKNRVGKKFSKSAPQNYKNIKLVKKFISSYKKLLIDLNIINLFNTKNEESNSPIVSDILKNKLQYKKNERKIILHDNKKDKKQVEKEEEEKEKIIKYFTPKKEIKCVYINKILEKGIVIKKKVRKEKNINHDKKPKHQHQAKKDRDEEIHMSDFKQKKEKMEIMGETEEEINKISKNEEKNDLKEKENKQNNNEDINENKTINKNEAIEEFLKDLENKNEDKNNIKNKKEDESEDPFEKAENEYRLQHNGLGEDEDDVLKNIDLDINEANDKEKENKNETTNINTNEIEKKEIKEDENLKEEIKFNEKLENTSNNKDKFSYFKEYIKSLNKQCKNFNPLIDQKPSNIYLKEVYQYQNYREKMKKYNRKTGQFDLFINKDSINKILTKEGNKYNEYNDYLKEKIINNNTLEAYRKYPKGINNKLINKFKDNKFSIKSFSNKNLTNTINTSRTNQKKNLLNNYFSKNNKERRIKTESNTKIKKGNNIKDMIHLLLYKENEKMNNKLNPINNKRRHSEQKEKIINVLNDPYNPYSTIWPNKFLNINYNSGIHYKEIEQGVPQLKIKNFKKKILPPIYLRNTLNVDNKLFYSTFSSELKKNLNAQSSNNIYNKKKINNKINNKTIEESKDININKNINELPKVLENINTNKKNESEVIEEEF